MKKQLIPLFIVLSISACTNTMSETAKEEPKSIAETEVVSSPELASYDQVERYSELLWVEQADPISDALQSLKQGDTKLWGYNTRMGPKVPGIDGGDVPTVLKKHQLKIAPAMGDTVHGAKHLELQLKFIDYAKRYNDEIIKS